ncbi:GNAT family N-acetyltransferase [Halobacillus litoralis]|uniref:GNAT family N-acetyltransferase n=1 Tax=Halobacillus litoralis TaxID=45668 RepID=UPI001CD759F1|nr:GNAT family N-acetyltransferase [Halobacillus litoralis]MCA0972124.1 GNAT family N-acetyltransferase [Halobacillus litoralis]
MSKLETGTGEKLKEDIGNAEQVLVYEQSGVKGVSCYSTYENSEESIAQMSLYIDPEYRRSGLGANLYKETEKLIAERDSDFVSVYLSESQEDGLQFAESMGFVKWWSSPELIYRGKPFSKTNGEFVKYDNVLYESFRKVVQDAYYDLHEKVDIKPYTASDDIVKQYQLKNKDRVYVVVQGEEVVASVTVGDGEIENLMVAPDHQGKGYGREALKFGVNTLLSEGYPEVRLCYVTGNEAAENLYSSIGFERLHTTHVCRKFM